MKLLVSSCKPYTMMMAPLSVAFALMLFYSSDRHYTIDQLADIFDADRDTISIWLTNWEEHAFDGLSDAARPGRPRKTSAKEDAMILREVQKHPQQSKTAVAALQKKDCSKPPDDSPSSQGSRVSLQTDCQASG